MGLFNFTTEGVGGHGARSFFKKANSFHFLTESFVDQMLSFRQSPIYLPPWIVLWVSEKCLRKPKVMRVLSVVLWKFWRSSRFRI